MRPTWIKISAVIAGLWLLVGGGILWTQSRRPTPEKIEAFVEANPLDGKSEAERAKVIDAVAAMVNKLDAEERKETQKKNDRIEMFWKSLTQPERARYVMAVMPPAINQLIESFDKMEPDRRRREVERAVRNLREQAEDAADAEVDPKVIRAIVDQGLKTFYSKASIEAKRDALPFLDELERSWKWR